MALTLITHSLCLFGGVFVGILIAALCSAAKWGDEHIERFKD